MRRITAATLAFLAFASSPGSAAEPARHPMSIDDVLDIVRLDRATLSPDGDWIAAVVQRPAREGEVYGRAAYEVDPGRADVWLISLRTGEKRNLTQGAIDAAGYWCATWSPDGRRLAMLSTKPEHGEPRGGDNVRLYVWSKDTGSLQRMGDDAVMAQTRYGSPLDVPDLRGGAGNDPSTQRCSEEDNAPFVWLNDRELLVLSLPAGAVAGPIDEYDRPSRHVAETRSALRGGVVPTVTAVGSGAERVPEAQRTMTTELRRMDVATGRASTVAALPLYPFRGELTVSVDPTGRTAALLAGVGTIPPVPGQRLLHEDESWRAEKKIGFVALVPGSTVRWSPLPAAGRYPLELYDWAPDARRVAFRARNSAASAQTPLFIADRVSGAVVAVGPGMAFDSGEAESASPHDRPLFWLDGKTLLARMDNAAQHSGAAAADPAWWRLPVGGAAEKLTFPTADVPSVLRQTAIRRQFLDSHGQLWTVDPSGRSFALRSKLGSDKDSAVVSPADPAVRISDAVIALGTGAGRSSYRLVSLDPAGSRSLPFSLPEKASVLAADSRHGIVISTEAALDGLYLRSTSLADGSERTLLALDTHLAKIAWGERMLIEHSGIDGHSLKAGVILPPGYRKGDRYPVIAWVYPSYQASSLEDYFLDPYLPGIYNLQLYAARGYVVLIPSLPLDRPPKEDILPLLAKEALASVDRLVELGIADPQRVGVMGQSFGGYGTYAIVTQADRFKAAVAMEGTTDLVSFYSEFDRAARGYPGIEHEKSVNWVIAELIQPGLPFPPYEDFATYWRNSPLAYVDRVQTPLLMIHGEYDKRASLSQAETFFFDLYRQGKTARLLRYWGESHSLAQSPANVRSIYEEILAWFDKYIGPNHAGPVHSAVPVAGSLR